MEVFLRFFRTSYDLAVISNGTYLETSCIVHIIYQIFSTFRKFKKTFNI